MPRLRICVCIKRLSFVVCLSVFLASILFTFSNPGGIKFDLKFIPGSYRSCEDLFVNTSVAGFFMSRTYNRRKKAFDEALVKATQGLPIESYSRQLREQYLVLHYLSGQLAAKRVCETGFNMGHSSFNYLTATDRSIVHSFDLGAHPYAYSMSEYLRYMFPSRFFIHFGKSSQTIPNFIRANPGYQCDLMFVDGGHEYDEALADLRNFAKIANLDANIVILNDFPTRWGYHLGMAWTRMVMEGVVEELMRCSFSNSGGARGFVVGRYTGRPEEAKLPGKEITT